MPDISPGQGCRQMKRMALAGVVGVVLVGVGSVAWGVRDAWATGQASGSVNQTLDLHSLGFQRQMLEEEHLRVLNRMEAKRGIIQAYLAGKMDTEGMVRALMDHNRNQPNTLEFLAVEYPRASERDIAVWHAVGLVEAEMDYARADMTTRLEAESWMREQGLVPALAW